MLHASAEAARRSPQSKPVKFLQYPHLRAHRIADLPTAKGAPIEAAHLATLRNAIYCDSIQKLRELPTPRDRAAIAATHDLHEV